MCLKSVSLKYVVLGFIIFFSASALLFGGLSKEEQELFDAIKNCNVEKVTELIKKKVNINVQEPSYGNTPIRSALFCDTTNILELLIIAGADLNPKDYENSTPLDVAAMNFFDTFAKELLVNGAQASSFMHNIPYAQELSDYRKAVDNKELKALANAITHNGANDSAFTKNQWLNFAVINNDGKQIWYAITKAKLFKAYEVAEGVILSSKRLSKKAFSYLLSDILLPLLNTKQIASLLKFSEKQNYKDAFDIINDYKNRSLLVKFNDKNINL